MSNKYTYYVFVRVFGPWDAVPVYTSTRDNMDAQANQYTIDNSYTSYIGPFKTKRGAQYMAEHGRSHFGSNAVAQAEQLAKVAKIKK